jgi:ABC-type cobalt transport system, ATPase component
LIRLEKVSFRYPSSQTYVIKDLNASFVAGMATAVVGANGSGKTTLVKLINGLLRPTSGKVFINDVDASKMSVAQIARHVGVVFQNPNHQIFSSTVYDEVCFALKNFGFSEKEIADRAKKALEKFGLLKYERSSPFLLSSGEKKRLTIACVWAYSPQILIFDEPTVGQDLKNKKLIWSVIKEHVTNGGCAIVVTHDLDFALNFDRMLILDSGKIVADGKPLELLYDESITRYALLVPDTIYLKRVLSFVNYQGDYEPKKLAELLKVYFK